ncbi:MAG: glycerol-3-phosphate dehydrogenase/oxidase [Planctomycetota bacterium]|nr:MAG: glycerol-3-phosphate dehydrogenase/oxidase [Planctomycetota bacterium]KAB2940006.1 MAG: glycerol-3-phosphate dehydrogenase/oxidase [Phycisphaerae bacterium]MCQ3921514.1 hypothetical protein [Planctomycetota bacterium]
MTSDRIGRIMTEPLRQTPHDVDCLILGGGITGAGAARDAAMRGLSVLLVDSDDFASGTSHLTSKLIHGGLRYLEYGQFRMVLEGVSERNRLLNHVAPNLVRPIRFVVPVEEHHLSSWLLQSSALKLYDLMGLFDGGRRSRSIGRVAFVKSFPFARPYPWAMTFWDAQTNDARLVLATLRTAEDAGACLMNYASLVAARRNTAGWHIHLEDRHTGVIYAVTARTIINATGPWAPKTSESLGVRPKALTWLKGTHIVLDRFPRFGQDAVVIRSVRDDRALWVVPWENRLLVGTTESRYGGDLRQVRPTVSEVGDLFESFVAGFPGLGATPDHLRMAFAGVRPIIEQDIENESALSRHYEIDVDAQHRLITVSGGKLTTFRRMAEHAVDQVCLMLGRRPVGRRARQRLRSEALWPGLVRGGPVDVHSSLTRQAREADLRESVITHLIRHYGVEAARIVGDMFEDPRTAEPLIEGLPHTLAEVAYLSRREHVRTLSDLVRRRTSLYFLADRELLPVLPRIARQVGDVLGWDQRRRDAEIAHVQSDLDEDTRALSEYQRTVRLPPPQETRSPAAVTA